MGKTLEEVITTTSPAAASTVATAPVPLTKYDELTVIAELQGATGGTLDVYIQETYDVDPSTGDALATATYYDVAHFEQLAGGAAAVVKRVATQRDSTEQTIGKNLTPALSAGKFVGSPWGPLVRLCLVAGASTSAGAPVTVKFMQRRNSEG